MMSTLVWVLGVSLSVSFLCSILEAVFLSVSVGHVALLREAGSRAGRYLHQMQRKIDEPIAAILTLNTIAHTVGASLGGALALEVFGNRWIAFFSAGLTLAILIFSEIVPKTLGATLWRELSRPTAYVLQGLIVVMKPILLPLSLFTRLIGGHRPKTVSRTELELLAEIGRREGTIDEDEWRVVSNVMTLDQVSVGEVMTPRTDIVAVPVDAGIAEAQDIMVERGHLRLPVYEETLDRIVGVLLARDLWRAGRKGSGEIRDLMRPVRFFPSTKAVEELIPEMRRRRSKMAMVVDEFGGTAGLVTLEDLIEEIVGEIQDEHELHEPVSFHPLPRGRMKIWGGVAVREVNERLDLHLPEDGHDTLGGYVFGLLNRIGRVGDEVTVEGGRLRVFAVRGRRIEFLIFDPSTLHAGQPED